MCYVSNTVVLYVPHTEEGDDSSIYINIDNRWMHGSTSLTPMFLVNLSAANLTTRWVSALYPHTIQLPNGPTFPPQPTFLINTPDTDNADPTNPPFGSYRVLEARPLGGFQYPIRERNNTDTTTNTPSAESIPEGMDNSGAPGHSSTCA